MASEGGSFWKRHRTLIMLGVIVIALLIIWEVWSRMRDIWEIGTAPDP